MIGKLKKTLNQTLSPERIQQIKLIRSHLTLRMRRIIASSETTSRIYYGLLSNEFNHEFRGVAAGRTKYLEAMLSKEKNRYMLRRNIHRLEKGLIMRPRRGVFAERYIGRTVAAYKERLAKQALSPELKWASDVLSEYFSIVQDDESQLIQEAKQTFDQLPTFEEQFEDQRSVHFRPYTLDAMAHPPVDYQSLLALARQRRSQRWFCQTPVPRELIDQALAVATLSPSACNRQAFNYRIFDDPKMTQAVASIPLGTQGFYQNFPCICVVVGDMSAYEFVKDRHVIYIDASLSSMAFLFALESLGLSSVCINWADLKEQERQMAEALNLEPNQRVVMLIAIGYAERGAKVPYSAKKAVSELRTYNALKVD